MSKSSLLHAALLLLPIAVAALPVRAELFTSLASSAGSASSASVSESIGSSSGSSSSDKKVAEGDYRVIEVAQAADRPQMLRLKLRAAEPASGHEFFLYLPDKALRNQPLVAGDLVQAHQRPYGFEFAHADTRQAFFLVLNDDWTRELESHVVAL